MNNDINEVSNKSDNPIFDIVNSIQSKLNESTTAHTVTENNVQNGLNGLDISKMLNMLNASKNTNNNMNINTASNSNLNLDLGTIMNLQKAFSSMNQADPRKDLLMSLKPFLRETRQKNIDTYVTFLGVMKALNIFTNKDRD